LTHEERMKRWDELGFLNNLKGPIKENITKLYEPKIFSLLNEPETEEL
jgi:hypothetical protein